MFNCEKFFQRHFHDAGLIDAGFFGVPAEQRVQIGIDFEKARNFEFSFKFHCQRGYTMDIRLQ
jgi:hypothetical protein